VTRILVEAEEMARRANSVTTTARTAQFPAEVPRRADEHAVFPFVHTGKLAAECIACRANALAAGLNPDICFRDSRTAAATTACVSVEKAFARVYFAEKKVAETARAETARAEAAAAKVQDEAEKDDRAARRECESALGELRTLLFGRGERPGDEL
jgi:hypothetical protein